jgi:predicted metalloprotease with PDZ domain
MSVTDKKAISLSYGAFALILLATLLVGFASGCVFGGLALSLFSRQTMTTPSQPAAPARAWVGITYIPINASVAAQRNLAVVAGALVVAVTAGSPAATAGLRENDVIVAVAQRELNDNTSVLDVIRDNKPGDKIEITYLRSGSQYTAQLVLGRSPSFASGADRGSLLERLRRSARDIFNR